MRDQQQKISGKWEKLKPYVGKLYPDDQTKPATSARWTAAWRT